MKISFENLTGREETHLITSKTLGFKLHPQVEAPLKRLISSAKKAGFDLNVISSFRSFESQKKIWDQKAEGKRPLLDLNSKPLERKDLSSLKLFEALLTWSALPGTSRHHWGVDFDIFCSKSLPSGYSLKLVPEEYAQNGIFNNFYCWLEENLPKHHFFFPYQNFFGGVGPEPWHISYLPLAQKFLEQYSLAIFKKNLLLDNFKLKNLAKKNIQQVYTRYFLNITPP